MAKLGARLRTGSARRAAGSRGPGPLLLVGLALLGAARAREPADGGFSLHPPYFNLAEGARITASATCGEEAPARGAPRPTEDLYCKLVGGPVAGGDPNQTIQVSAGRGWVAAGRAGWRGRRRGDAGAGDGLGGERPGTDRSPRAPCRRAGSAFRETGGTPARPFWLGQSSARPAVRAGRSVPGRRWQGGRGAGSRSLVAPSPGILARAGLGFQRGCRWGRGGPALPFPRAGWNLPARKPLGGRREGRASWSLEPDTEGFTAGAEG